MARQSTKARRRRPVARKKILIFEWPAVAFVLLCTGVLLVGWTFLATADTIHVSAKISAPLPSGPATITAPTDGQHFTSVPITVTGTCPADGSGAYVKLFRNDVFSGVALCDASQNFNLNSDLFAGANILKAVIFNKTDDPGADSNTPTVYYDVPQPPPVNLSTPVAPQILPFIISTDFKYTGFYVGQTIHWRLTASGGNPPYAININWGDGNNSVVSRKGSGDFTADHQYTKPGGYKGSYKIVITGADSSGNATSLQLFALVNPATSGPITGTTYNPPPLASTKGWLVLIWPAYLIVTLMTASYLLGEREELLVLKRRAAPRKRRA